MKRSLWMYIMALLSLQLPVASRNVIASEPVKAEIPAGSGSVKVKIIGLRNANGKLAVALFNEKKGFPGKFDRAFWNIVVPAAASGNMVVFDDVPFGRYAVAVRHDENGNGKLDTNFIGMPKEGVGASNNPKSRFSPPSFDDAAFVLDYDGMELIIKLRYL